MLRLQSPRLARFRFAAFVFGSCGFLLSLVAAVVLHPAFLLIWLMAAAATVCMIGYQQRWAACFARIARMHGRERHRFNMAECAAAQDVQFREITGAAGAQ